MAGRQPGRGRMDGIAGSRPDRGRVRRAPIPAAWREPSHLIIPFVGHRVPGVPLAERLGSPPRVQGWGSCLVGGLRPGSCRGRRHVAGARPAVPLRRQLVPVTPFPAAGSRRRGWPPAAGRSARDSRPLPRYSCHAMAASDCASPSAVASVSPAARLSIASGVSTGPPFQGYGARRPPHLARLRATRFGMVAAWRDSLREPAEERGPGVVGGDRGQGEVRAVQAALTA